MRQNRFLQRETITGARDEVSVDSALAPSARSVERAPLGRAGLRRIALRFCGVILGVYFFFAIFLDRPHGPSVRPALCHFTASLTCDALRLAGKGARVSGSIIYPAFAPPVEVILGCTGFLSMLIFTAFVLALPGSGLCKALGITAGCCIILFFNVLRLLLYIFVSAHHPALNHVLHDYVYSALHILLNIGLCVVWLEKVARPELIPSR